MGSELEQSIKKNIIVSIVIFLRNINDHGFEFWTQVREEAGALYGKWEFPGGKIEALETAEFAARREVHEEVGILIPATSVLHQFKIQDYSFNGRNLCLYVFVSNYDMLPQEKGQWNDLRYGQKSTYLEGKIPAINHVILDELAVYIEKQHHSNMLEILWPM